MSKSLNFVWVQLKYLSLDQCHLMNESISRNAEKVLLVRFLQTGGGSSLIYIFKDQKQI